jgi:hypothetical protein
MQARVNLALDIEVSALEFGRGGGLSSLAGRILPQLGRTAAPVAVSTPAVV